eukprot:CFRG7421T1
MSRPEHQAPPELFYSATEAKKYAVNSRMQSIQTSMTQRALELLNLSADHPSYLLDIGCGTGLSGEELTENGHFWVGMDISPHMLAQGLDRGVEGDLLWHDMGQGVMFRPGTFDGVVSISALQWLCNADKSYHVPKQRLNKFFTTLYSAMKRGARAVFQFYPETPQQMELITQSAMKAGFTGGAVVDYPNSTKAKKIFLCLFAGVGASVPKGLDGMSAEEKKFQSVAFVERAKSKSTRKHGSDRGSVKSKDWVQAKKERGRKQGKDVRHDSKFTARNRKPKF